MQGKNMLQGKEAKGKGRGTDKGASPTAGAPGRLTIRAREGSGWVWGLRAAKIQKNHTKQGAPTPLPPLLTLACL